MKIIANPCYRGRSRELAKLGERITGKKFYTSGESFHAKQEVVGL